MMEPLAAALGDALLETVRATVSDRKAHLETVRPTVFDAKTQLENFHPAAVRRRFLILSLTSKPLC